MMILLEITELANKVISLHRQIIIDYEGLLNAKMGIRAFTLSVSS